MPRPTLISLARELGVSRQTISNVINAPHLVREETRERVRAGIKASGYRPSAAARALRTRRSFTVGMRLAPLTDGIHGAIMDRLLHATTEALQARGYQPTLFTAATADEEVAKLGDLFDSGVIDAGILAYGDAGDTRPAALTARAVPFVTFGRPWDDDAATHAWVDVDNAVGVTEATRHLQGLGHRRIGFIGWDGASDVGAERRQGWLAGMTGEADLEQLEMITDDGVCEGAVAMAELRSRGATAAVCASDSLALGALSHLRADPPEGFDPASAVFGFDDSPVAQALGLSSVAQPVGEVAGVLVGLLIETLSGSVADRDVMLPSTARPRDRHIVGDHAVCYSVHEPA
mgnify:CR=1 FL=1